MTSDEWRESSRASALITNLLSQTTLVPVAYRLKRHFAIVSHMTTLYFDGLCLRHTVGEHVLFSLLATGYSVTNLDTRGVFRSVRPFLRVGDYGKALRSQHGRRRSLSAPSGRLPAQPHRRNGRRTWLKTNTLGTKATKPFTPSALHRQISPSLLSTASPYTKS